MDLVINILFGLIILTMVLVALYNNIPKIEEILEDKFNIKVNIARRSAKNSVLSQIFIKYNHKDIDAWIEWMKLSNPNTRNKAIETIINHIESAPANWGGVTAEAIRALSKFRNKDHIATFRETLAVAKKSWLKYKVSSSCYEAALKAIIEIDEDLGIKTLEDELTKKLSVGNDGKTISIVNALSACSEEANIDNLYIKILSNPEETLRAKNHTINVILKSSPEKSSNIFFACFKKYIDETKEPISLDNLNIYETIFNQCVKANNSKSFDYVLQACNHKFLAKSTLNILDLVIKSSKETFQPDQLYKLLFNIKDEREIIKGALEVSHSLNITEKKILKYNDPLQVFKFEKAPLVVVNIENATAIEVPKIISEYYDSLLTAIKDRGRMKQSGQAGGILITGCAEEEKLLLCRAISVERRWSFIYGNYNDLASSGSRTKNFLDAMNRNKPCIAYIDNFKQILNNQNDSFVKNLRMIANEPSIFLIGSINEDAPVNDRGYSKLIETSQDLMYLFPKTLEINKCSDSFKNRILMNKLTGISPNRGLDVIEELEINKPTEDMTPLEYEKFLVDYLTISLLIFGKLVHSDEFNKLTVYQQEDLATV